MSFADDLAKYCKAAGDKVEQVVRKSALEVLAGMMSKSPVDTGRFKSNWQCGIGGINSDTSAAPNSDALGRTGVVLETWRPGQTIFLSNSLPYAKRLENGWSQQAPAGIVRLTVQDFAQAVKRAVEAAK
ncbi:HK97 gp10 family phage protein [Comamonas odontotermitis]|uniref:HK97 gp10 family phage protein n=1 Tax=Comamonas odontotermitis TaxID=379895 RepID=UPI001CC7A9FC|nr:HK97 gp10 family phage protein [Comamonas odontotermitis]UBB18366.1 HK97 gp10 family phage protein [Comamonas odontotermitis]